MSALFWPFAHAGGYNHPVWLSFTPLLLSGSELLKHWILRGLSWVAVLYAELSWSWGAVVTLHHLKLVIGGALQQLLLLPVRDWNQISAHVAVPMLLLGGLLGWILFRQCRRYTQAIALLALGAIIIPLNHVLWKLPGEISLAAYLTIGLTVLIDLHRTGLLVGSRPTAWSKSQYLLWGLVALLPLGIGWQLPAHASTDPLGVFKGDLLPGLLPSTGTTATTGYGPGVTQIGHSLTASRTPIFLAKSPQPYYWEAATYTHFDGRDWSNTQKGLVYQAGPSDFGIPLVQPYFSPSLTTHTTHVHITSLLPGATLTTLFYTGVPTNFSVPVSVHTAASLFQSEGVKQYRLTAKIPSYNITALDNSAYSAPPHRLKEDLQLPHNLSPRVDALARKVAGGASGPWQAAQDIKNYLDDHYRYSLRVTPTHSNVVNHFLFVDKKGYCDQFSTTFIMMMRSLNIPARWVVGYDAGTYDAAQHGYLVRALDAHSWAQIWIANIGWVPIDPTPGFATPTSYIHGGGAASNPATSKRSLNTANPSGHPGRAPQIHPLGGAAAHHRRAAHLNAPHRAIPSTHRQGSTTILAVCAMLVLGAVGWGISRRRHQDHRVASVWAGIRKVSRRKLGMRWQAKSPRQWGQDWLRYFPDDREQIWPLVHLLEAAFYRQAALSGDEQRQLKELWTVLKQRRRPSA